MAEAGARSGRLRRVIGTVLVGIGLMGAGAVTFWWLIRDDLAIASATPTTIAFSGSLEDAEPVMPPLEGLALDQALLALEAIGTDPSTVTTVEQETTGQSGYVVRQSPPAGRSSPSGVVLTVSKRIIVMPDIRGLAETEARLVLADAGIADAAVTYVTAPAAGEPGRVITQLPRPGDRNPSELTITLSEPAATPDVVGDIGIRAADELAFLGAAVSIETRYDPDVEPGTVIEQSAAPGAPLPDSIVLVVSAEPGRLALTSLDRVAVDDCSSRSAQVGGDEYRASIRCQTRPESDSPAYVEYNLARDFSSLTITLGISDLEEDTSASARFTVIADGLSLGTWSASFGESNAIDLDVSDVLRLRLEVTVSAPDNALIDVIWADPTLLGDPDVVAAYE